MPITLLPAEVIDQIAAGEVVERPAHLVKELVENSLDAHAKKIVVEFSEGGRFIQVSDNGIGIDPDDLATALDRFATSKIHHTDDLWKLQTYGFRGEALASIAAVSRLSLVSRTAAQEKASRLVSEFGKKGSREEVGGVLGTKISVEELFANVPARLKFMRSATAEHSQIKQTLKALALCRPDVEFQVFENKQMLEAWPAADHYLKRAAQILPVKELFHHRREHLGMIADLVFASPHEVGKTSKQIWIFVQGRWVQDRSLQAAVMEAYRNLLMHGEYPVAAVWLQVPPDQVDVNIHPTKSQVKFVDPQNVFRMVQTTLRQGLEAAPWFREVASSTPHIPPTVSSPTNLSFGGSSFEQVHYARKENFVSPAMTLKDFAVSAKGRDEFSVAVSVGENSTTTGQGVWSRLQVLAQAHLTYLVCQSEKGLVFVDQHAAHERVMFERLMRDWQRGVLDVQEFLFPLAVDLSPDQIEVLFRHHEDLQKLGISIESLGPQTLGVKSAPSVVKDEALHQALQKTAEDLLERGGSFALEKMMADLCARLACHSAVRAGQSLSLEQMNNLLAEMNEFPLSSFCPHGRPVSVEYPFYELEKDFGRIV